MIYSRVVEILTRIGRLLGEEWQSEYYHMNISVESAEFDSIRIRIGNPSNLQTEVVADVNNRDVISLHTLPNPTITASKMLIWSNQVIKNRRDLKMSEYNCFGDEWYSMGERTSNGQRYLYGYHTSVVTTTSNSKRIVVGECVEYRLIP